jgi:hypothetical protein
MLRIVEKSRGVSKAVYLGKVSVAWLLTTVAVIQGGVDGVCEDLKGR